MVRIITENAQKGTPRRKRAPLTAAQIEAQVELEAARDADAARRLDTRRKVVIGGALIALAEHDATAARLLATLKRGLTRAADRKLFAVDPPNG